MSCRIPVSLKQNVWVKYNGEVFDAKCYVVWCKNKTTPFNFETGHDVPSSKGGSTTIDNLRPICGSCNKSMGNRYTIQEFSEAFKPIEIVKDKKPKKRLSLYCCLFE